MGCQQGDMRYFFLHRPGCEQPFKRAVKCVWNGALLWIVVIERWNNPEPCVNSYRIKYYANPLPCGCFLRLPSTSFRRKFTGKTRHRSLFAHRTNASFKNHRMETFLVTRIIEFYSDFLGIWILLTFQKIKRGAPRAELN